MASDSLVRCVVLLLRFGPFERAFFELVFQEFGHWNVKVDGVNSTCRHVIYDMQLRQKVFVSPFLPQYCNEEL